MIDVKKMTRTYLPLASLCLVALLAGCKQAPDPMYVGPPGAGGLVYEPGVGITRENAATNQTEQTLFNSAEAAFDERRWDECIAFSLALTQTYPEGSRAVDAILLRIRAQFEAGRAGAESRLSTALSLDRWMFVYLAPNHDDDLRALMAGTAQTREVATQIRALPVQEFIEMLEPDAYAIYRSGRLEAAQRDVETLANFYLPAIQLSRYRRDVGNLGRDVCWLMYAAQDFNRTIFTAEDMLSINPPPSVKADTLFIMGHAQRRNGAAPIAANTFGLLYRGAGLRDTDTRWRPYALMWQIDQTMATSKGYIYDRVYYERADELLGEYELYRFENPNIPESLHSQFILLLEKVYGVFVERHLNAADTYSRLGESAARDYYIALAEETEEKLVARKKALQPGPQAG